MLICTDPFINLGLSRLQSYFMDGISHSALDELPPVQLAFLYLMIAVTVTSQKRKMDYDPIVYGHDSLPDVNLDEILPLASRYLEEAEKVNTTRLHVIYAYLLRMVLARLRSSPAEKQARFCSKSSKLFLSQAIFYAQASARRCLRVRTVECSQGSQALSTHYWRGSRL